MAVWSLFERGPLESKWRYPRTVVILGEVATEQVAGLLAQLAQLAQSQNGLGLEQLGGLHFFRLFLLRDDHDLRGRPLPARLVLSAVFDSREADFLRELARFPNGQLRKVLQYCDSFPEVAGPDEVYGWLQKHVERSQAVHVGTLRDDLPYMQEEHELRVAIGRFLDERNAAGDWQTTDVNKIRLGVQEFVRTQSHLPQKPRPATPWRLWLLEFLDALKVLVMIAVPPTILAILHVWWWSWSWWHLFWLIPAISLGLVLIYFLVVRFYELVEGDLVVLPRPGQVAKLLDAEDFGIQNQITLAVPVRDSHFRRLNLRFILWIANAVSKHWYRRGQLVGIDTIHFARFNLIDNGRRMMFVSDFDGGWDRYLFDFLDVGSLAVVPIWSNLHGCPKTRFLRFPVRGFSQRFMPFTRAYQQPTQIWYSAVNHLTVAEIKRNAEARAGLFGRRSRRAIKAWLKLF